MKVKTVTLNHFKRFSDFRIVDLPPAKLVILAGPNGSGKSSLFDSFSAWSQAHSGLGFNWDPTYHLRPGVNADNQVPEWNQAVQVELHQPLPTDQESRRKIFYFRSAYRNDPDFKLNQLSRQGDVTAERRFHRMIESDAAVTSNYQRLVSQAFASAFLGEDASTTLGVWREKIIGEIRNALLRLFPDLLLNSLGDPLANGTFQFDKGSAKGFLYKNLSGGEKAAFDLVLDLVVKRRDYDDTVFCIDEPEAHMNTRLQAALLQELYGLIPDQSQLWVATHSIGMMRKARELAEAKPYDIVFLDFGGHNFDHKTILAPVKPTRAFWQSVLSVALDDLASLVAPREVVVCEGHPVTPAPGKNAEHDARCYDTIFAGEFPDVSFLSAGSAKEVAADRLAFAAALAKVVPGIKVRRVIDRDDHAPADVAAFNAQGIRVLSRRHLEAYLYADEVLTALCNDCGQPAVAPALLDAKASALHDSITARGNPPDDVKSAAPQIYAAAKRLLGLTGVGNDQQAFARNALAPLLKPGMATYAELRQAIFGA